MVWDFDTINKEIYLTFDDGPIPELTPYVLDILDDLNAKATFFCVGENILKHPGIARNIIQRGHVIGNHTHNHIKGWQYSVTDYIKNVAQFEQAYLDVINHPAPKIFRPPYGRMRKPQIKALKNRGYRIIMWNLLSYDFDNKANPETGLRKMIGKTQNGSIIVFHDNLKASKSLKIILPGYIKVFSERGFAFKTLI